MYRVTRGARQLAACAACVVGWQSRPYRDRLACGERAVFLFRINVLLKLRVDRDTSRRNHKEAQGNVEHGCARRVFRNFSASVVGAEPTVKDPHSCISTCVVVLASGVQMILRTSVLGGYVCLASNSHCAEVAVTVLRIC